jgi:nucleoside-diphosphate-sugar epimerase
VNSALFGFTGFVGGNLESQHPFDDLFNSANSAESCGRHYDLVIFAAARAEKWRINQDAAGDRQHISELEALISGVSATRFVLISTVDVYRDPTSVDEHSPIVTDGLDPYGAHRYQLERHVRAAHPNALIVRLPGLFGPGLKKNVVFDLLHDNNLDRVNADAAFQYYNLAHLFEDVTLALNADLRLVNLTSPPLRTADLARLAFGRKFENRLGGAAPKSYDVRTVHAPVFGGEGAYTRSAAQTLAELTAFVAAERMAAERMAAEQIAAQRMAAQEVAW